MLKVLGTNMKSTDCSPMVLVRFLMRCVRVSVQWQVVKVSPKYSSGTQVDSQKGQFGRVTMLKVLGTNMKSTDCSPMVLVCFL